MLKHLLSAIVMFIALLAGTKSVLPWMATQDPSIWVHMVAVFVFLLVLAIFVKKARHPVFHVMLSLAIIQILSAFDPTLDLAKYYTGTINQLSAFAVGGKAVMMSPMQVIAAVLWIVTIVIGLLMRSDP